jgi:hypothetical protein
MFQDDDNGQYYNYNQDGYHHQSQSARDTFDYLLVQTHGRDTEPILAFIEHCKIWSRARITLRGRITVHHMSAKRIELAVLVHGRSLDTLDLQPEMLNQLVAGAT